MASILNIQTNRSYGTYVTDGVRTGPQYTNLPTSLLPDANGNFIVGYYNNYGPALLLSTQNTWNIVPYPSTAGNIVATTAVVAPKFLTLTQDNEATTRVSNPNFPVVPVIAGAPAQGFIQFDWPRVPSVVVAGAAMTGPSSVTLFGTDWYGFPMQHTYVVQATGTYPANISAAAKAFYTISAIYCNGVTGGGGSITIQTTDIFGLPYALPSWANAMNFSWNGSNLKDLHGGADLINGVATIQTAAIGAGTEVLLSHVSLTGSADTDISDVGTILYLSATVPVVPYKSFTIQSATNAGPAADDNSRVAWSIPDSGKNLVAPAISVPATALGGDVRGLFQVSSAANGVKRALFTSYYPGADQWLNQLSAGEQPQGAGTVPPLSAAQLYGVPQYFTGVPA